MKGTIDQIETIYSSVSGIWWRILTFAIVCWAGYIIGVLAASLLWDSHLGLHADYLQEDWWIDPASWIMQSFSKAEDAFGSLRLLFVGGAALVVFFTQVNLCRMACLLFTEESWFWWYEKSRIEDYLNTPSGAPWHLLLPLLTLATFATVWVGWRSWRNDHPIEDLGA